MTAWNFGLLGMERRKRPGLGPGTFGLGDWLDEEARPGGDAARPGVAGRMPGPAGGWPGSAGMRPGPERRRSGLGAAGGCGFVLWVTEYKTYNFAIYHFCN